LVLRGEQTVTMRLKFATVEQHKDPGIDAATPQKNIVRQLSVVATTLTKEMAGKIHALRIASGVVVIARTADPTEAQLEAGDVIHSVNNVPVGDIDNLRARSKSSNTVMQSYFKWSARAACNL